MTVEEIFTQLCAHMKKGLMIHNQISNAFGFLNLYGYQKCHEYHYYEESKNCINLQDYYLTQYNKLIPDVKFEAPELIASNWFKHTREEVDTNTKRKGIKELTQAWINWELETQKNLNIYYKELYNLNEISAALKIAQFLVDVDNELKIARNKYISLEAIDYDIVSIAEEQENLYNKYVKKIKHIF